ncbi:DUF6520 family protein [Sinomicrobium weinanense]|uniref:Uncharacterized protein n=1 Tax=Sinomicrobium weinanense TaxID=2842200 RepID=A0A926JUD9_9FLAO|nr:DUF6520 family protein [Sinomicrobium weinanense]MBC9797713.1 hypothetical protein [Sinomicrobium weinanense]MBU3122261.1 hypothetical protein [Sinomicrobium weinanense]
MKTKKLILGSLVFVFAIGTAFASLMQDLRTIHVKALLTNGEEECVALDKQCDNDGQFECTVQINNVQQGPNTTSNTYFDSACSNPLFHTSSATVTNANATGLPAGVQIDELLEP